MRLFFIFIFVIAEIIFAGESNLNQMKLQKNDFKVCEPVPFNSEKFSLLQDASGQISQNIEVSAAKKSTIKAAFLSGLIPGAGEVYAKSYWRAAIFAGIEIVLWTANINYENKGDKEDKRMRAFGDTHWNEQKYWSKVYDEAVADGKWTGDLLTLNGMYISDADYNNPEVINKLRTMEHAIGYTHSLPETKTQQYYEMIYKYLHQFGVAWDDLSKLTNGDEDATWGYYEIYGNLGNLSPNTETYRSMRNRSNDYYQTATDMINLALLNHVLSAFDAALAVKQFNKKVNYAVRVNRQLNGYEYVTTYGLYFSW
jgi:hypothetical protein